MKHKFVSLKTSVFVLFLITSVLTLASFFSKQPEYIYGSIDKDERFDTSFLSIDNSVIIDFVVDQKFKNSNYDTSKTVLFLDHLVRNRFYHSYSVLTFHDNWIANLCGKFIWAHFSNPVVSSDILKYPMGACSQQGIVFQDQLTRLKIPCSTIEFYPLSTTNPGHYAVSVYYDKGWHYYDSNKEPLIVDSTMPSVATIIDKKLYEKMYVRKSNRDFQSHFKNRSLQKINRVPFKKGNMYYFQITTSFLSHWLWLFLLLLFLFLPKKATLD
ncbi:hypothetical protein [Aurantibacillus circumpalustris]|uniref:hypothetical protein n=1 Tax=Aurantibacillus circumpalustris TaxID=3036359 RepID=UPI00295BBC7E|nr:hypothetical protein [Aurantibacillus circumpalustris]